MIFKELSSSIEQTLGLSTSSSLSSQAINSVNDDLKKYTTLLEHGRIPKESWSDFEIEKFLQFVASMDSNNFRHNVGVGEREGRVACGLVQRRNYGFAHGIGRSGSLAEIQPKAAGSALLYNLTNRLTRHALLVAGFHKSVLGKCSVFPVATGMAMLLCLSALRRQRPLAKYVLWLRIDQKSCLKAIIASGFTPIVVEGEIDPNGQVQTSIGNIKMALETYSSEDILCLISCTSCFAPRACDKLPEIGEICKEHQIPHIVNNAYGVQSSRAVHMINECSRLDGQLDMIVQSTDKNFMVPVGGSIIVSRDKTMLESVESIYPGRASSSQVIDLCATLLHFGEDGFKELLKERKSNFEYFKQILGESSYALIPTPHNDISMAIKVDSQKIGSTLFLKGVSGARVVTPGQDKVIDGICLKSFGTHHSDYTAQYLTVASAVGQSKADIDHFLKTMQKCKNQN